MTPGSQGHNNFITTSWRLLINLPNLLFYVHSKQLCHVGMVSYLTTLFLGKPPRGSLPVFSTFLLPVTDNLLFIESPEEAKKCSTKELPDARVDLRATCI